MKKYIDNCPKLTRISRSGWNARRIIGSFSFFDGSMIMVSSRANVCKINICFHPLFLVYVFPTIKLTDSFSVETDSESISSSFDKSAMLWLKRSSSALCYYSHLQRLSSFCLNYASFFTSFVSTPAIASFLPCSRCLSRNAMSSSTVFNTNTSW